MRHTASLCTALLLAVLVIPEPALGDEQIVRLRVFNRDTMLGRPGEPNLIVANQVEIFSLGASPDEIPGLSAFKANTFHVYTKEEIDTKLAKEAKTISNLSDLVLVLRQNLKDLSDVNDALVKRLEEIETRLNQSN